MSSNGYKDHSLASILPLMESAELNNLAEDIARNGLRTPITLYENKILDGRNRYRACSMVNVEPKIRQFTSGDPLAFIVSANVHRRHLTESQRALVAGKIANLKSGGQPRDESANLQTQKSVAKAAEELNVSPRSVATAKKVLKEAPKKDIKAIEDGKKTVAGVAKELKKKTEAKAERLDKTGYTIPEPILEDWDRAEAFSDILRSLSKIKTTVANGLKERDVIFREVTNTTIATLQNAHGDLGRVLPHAVCTSCQGRTRDKCVLCKGRGYLSKFTYDTCVSDQTKKIREAAIKK